MISKNIKKTIVALALLLSVVFTGGVSDNLLDTAFTAQASATCVGGGSGSGGGC